MRPSNLRITSTLTASLLLLAPALAQNAFRPLPAVPDAFAGAAGPTATVASSYMEELEKAASAPRPRSFFDARAFGEASTSGGLTGGGEVSSQRGGWQVLFGSRLDDERLAAFSVSTEASFYNLGGSNQLVPGNSKPFNDLYRASVSGIVRTPSDEGAGWFAGFELALGGEDEASPRDSLVAGGVGGVHYVASKDLSVDVGLAVLSRLEDDPWIWPFLGLKWQATDRLSFEARGTSIEGRLALDEAWSLFGRAQYQLRQFRLNDDNPLPSGVFRDEEIRAGLGVSRRAGDGFEVELFGGVNLWRELSTLDRDGALQSELEVDPAPFVAFSLKLSV